jgi:TnpA family transposase
MLAAKDSGLDQVAAVERALGWERLRTLVAEAEPIAAEAREDNLSEIVDRYPTMRRAAPILLDAFTFRSWKPEDLLLAALEVLRKLHAGDAKTLPPRPPTAFLRAGWRKLVGSGGGGDRRAYEVAVLMTLRDRLRSGDVWVDGSRAFRAFDDFLLPAQAFAVRRQNGELGLAVPDSFAQWRNEKMGLLEARLREIDALAVAGELPDAALTEEGLSISPIRKDDTDASDQLARRLYGMLPRLRITELLAEVHSWTGFAERFRHLRTGEPPADDLALMTALLADATNLGLARMARSSKTFSHSKLLWVAEWHVRDETYQAALACLVDAIHAQPFTRIWGDGDTSSSDGQFFRAGGHGEARADYNAKYGSELGVKFYTHVSDRYAPFHIQVIAANASEAAHILDGLLHRECSLAIREHYTDTGAIDHVFGLCGLTGFRFAPRIRDLADRRLYVVAGRPPYKALASIIGGAVNFNLIGENWDETWRLAASIKAGTVAPSVLMRRLAAYPKQNALARALREIGRLERTLFTLDWISDPALRAAPTPASTKARRATPSLGRCSFIASTRSVIAPLRIRNTAPPASISSSPPSSFGTPSISATPSPNCALVAKFSPTTFWRTSRRSVGSTSPLTATTSGQPSPSKTSFGPSAILAQTSSTPLSVGFGTDSAMTPYRLVKLRQIEAFDKAPHHARAMVRRQKPLEIDHIPTQLPSVRPHHPSFAHRRFTPQNQRQRITARSKEPISSHARKRA